MREFFSKLFSRSSRRRVAKRKFRRVQFGAEQLEMRSMLATTGIVVNNDNSVVHGDYIVSFPYSGGPSGMFSVVDSGRLPPVAFQSPGMPPQNGRQ